MTAWGGSHPALPAASKCHRINDLGTPSGEKELSGSMTRRLGRTVSECLARINHSFSLRCRFPCRPLACPICRYSVAENLINSAAQVTHVESVRLKRAKILRAKILCRTSRNPLEEPKTIDGPTPACTMTCAFLGRFPGDYKPF